MPLSAKSKTQKKAALEKKEKTILPPKSKETARLKEKTLEEKKLPAHKLSEKIELAPEKKEPPKKVSTEPKTSAKSKKMQPLAPKGPHAKELAKEKKIISKEPPQELPISLPPTHGIQPLQMAEVTPPPSPLQNEQIAKLFAHMVSQITSVVRQGETHTTISLSGANFKNSVFFGSQIVIKESSTAPRTYNIELYGATREAQALFEDNVDNLLQMFQEKKFRFNIHRIQTGHATKGAVKRKESNKDNAGGSP